MAISGTRARTSSYRPKAWYDTRRIFGSPVPASRHTSSARAWIVTGLVFPTLKISPTARGENIARTRPSTVSSTYVKLRVCWPSPWTSISWPRSAASMNTDCGPPHHVRFWPGP